MKEENPHVIYLYSVYDKKGERYDTPFFCANDLFANRVFSLRMDEEKSFLKEWPEDFVLYKIGYFDVLEGEFGMQKQEIMKGETLSKNKG